MLYTPLLCCFFKAWRCPLPLQLICFDLCLWRPCVGDNINHFYCFCCKSPGVNAGQLLHVQLGRVGDGSSGPLRRLQTYTADRIPFVSGVTLGPFSDPLGAMLCVTLTMYYLLPLPSRPLCCLAAEGRKRKREEKKNLMWLPSDYASGWNSKVVPLLI